MTPNLFELVETDNFDYPNLASFVDMAVGSALVDCARFWQDLIGVVAPLFEPERARYLAEMKTLHLTEFLSNGENAQDRHFHFIPNATYAGVVEALLGGVRDPVSTFEMFEANNFREDNAYYDKMRGFFRSKDEPRSFTEWLVHRAYHEGFPLGLRRMKNGVNPLPDWWEERFANMGKRDFWGRHVE
jgi:hypothetical protein